jgi:UDP-N-acetylmuramoyl-tripeptide--D-alanyl-D-alanine ligase
MRAAIETLAATRPDACGRRIAALGEMRELGRRSAEFHLALADILKANGVDRVFACGPAMKPMFDSLPKAMRGGYAPESSTLARQVSAAIRGGDVVVVKGSLASGMKVVVDALLAAGSTSSRAVNG